MDLKQHLLPHRLTRRSSMTEPDTHESYNDGGTEDWSRLWHPYLFIVSSVVMIILIAVF